MSQKQDIFSHQARDHPPPNLHSPTHPVASVFDELPVGPPPEFRPADLEFFRSAPDLLERPREDEDPAESEFWNRSAPVPAGLRLVSLRRISAGRDLPSDLAIVVPFFRVRRAPSRPWAARFKRNRR